MQTKRLAAPRHYPISRKRHKFTVFPKGPHKKEYGLPLAVIIRDVLKLADTRKEVKKILNDNGVLIDGKVRKDSYCVGVMDVLSIPSIKKNYRVLADKKGLILKEIPDKEKELKIARVESIRNVKGGKYQICLHDGKTILSEEKYVPFTSLIISVPKLKIIKSLPFEKGYLAMVRKGPHAGKTAKISRIESNLVYFEGAEKFSTIKNYVFVIGKEKPELSI